MPYRIIAFGLMMFCELIYHFFKIQLSFAYQQMALSYWKCYWKSLLIVFVASLPHQALIPCGAKGYFSKLVYQLFLVQYFWKKLKTIKFQFFYHSWSLKCHNILRMGHTRYQRPTYNAFKYPPIKSYQLLIKLKKNKEQEKILLHVFNAMFIKKRREFLPTH